MAHGRTSFARARVSAQRLLALSPAALAAATILLAGSDWAYRVAGDSFFPGGPLDEIAHFLTTLLVLWALGPRVCERFLVPALIASVAIDLDHIPADLGGQWLTAGTPRPYTHSLLTVVIVLAIGLVWRRRRDLMPAIAIGLTLHLWRDMAEGDTGVSLLWPISYHSFQYPRSIYLSVMAGCVLISAARCAAGRRAADRSDGVPRHEIKRKLLRTPEEV
jgi:inner membrane protein